MHDVPTPDWQPDDDKKKRREHEETEIREPRQHPQEPAVEDPPANPVQDVPVEEPPSRR